MPSIYTCRIYLLLSSVCISFCTLVRAQEDKNYSHSDIIQSVIEDNEEEDEDSGTLQDIEENHSGLLDINEAGMDDLLRFPFMDLNSARLIIGYRKTRGHIFSKGELLQIDSLDRSVILSLFPLISAGRPDRNKPSQDIPHSYSIFKIRTSGSYPLPDKYSRMNYTGSRIKIHSFIKAVPDDRVTVFFQTEKDAFEKMLLDFSSFSLHVKPSENSPEFILGDYKIRFGQGLVLSSAGKISGINNLLRNPAGYSCRVNPYSSTGENRFFRGLSAFLPLSNIPLILFISSNNIDAVIDTNLNIIKSFPSDGLHRSSSEIEKKDRAKSRIYGAAAEWYPSDQISLGLLYLYEAFSLPVYSEKSSESRSIFRTVSVTYRCWTNQFIISGETALRNNNAHVTVNTINIRLHHNLKFASSIRYFNAGAQSLYANNYSSQTSGKYKETGITAGLYIKTALGKFDIFYEYFSCPEGSGYSSFSSSGRNTVINYRISGKIFALSCRIKYSRISDQENANLSFGQRNTYSFKIVPEYILTRTLNLKSGFEYRSISGNEDNKPGYYFFSGFAIRPSENTDIKCRVIFFSSSFNTRLTEYENDLDGLTGITVLSGKGMRYYILGRIRPGNSISLQAKYSFQIEDSDQNNIIASRTSAVSLQAEIKF